MVCMKFNQLLKELVPESTVGKVIAYLGISPKTLKNWMNGHGVPSEKNLELLIDFLPKNEEISEKLRSLRMFYLADKKKTESTESFSVYLKKLIKEVDCSVYELANQSGVTRAAMYSWMDKRNVPSMSKLNALVKCLKLTHNQKEKLYSLYDDSRRSQPRIRTRVAADEEASRVKDIFSELTSMGFQVSKSDSPFYDIGILQNLNQGSLNIVATVSFRKRITSIDSVFTVACESKRITGAFRAYVVVETLVTNRMQDLFDHHKIMVLTVDQFLKIISIDSIERKESHDTKM